MVCGRWKCAYKLACWFTWALGAVPQPACVTTPTLIASSTTCIHSRTSPLTARLQIDMAFWPWKQIEDIDSHPQLMGVLSTYLDTDTACVQQPWVYKLAQARCLAGLQSQTVSSGVALLACLQAAIIEAGALPALTGLLERAQPDGQYAAAAALYNLAGQEPQVRLALVTLGAIPYLVNMLRAESWHASSLCCTACSPAMYYCLLCALHTGLCMMCCMSFPCLLMCFSSRYLTFQQLFCKAHYLASIKTSWCSHFVLLCSDLHPAKHHVQCALVCKQVCDLAAMA